MSTSRNWEKDDAHAAHLSGHVGEGETTIRQITATTRAVVAVVTAADEVRHRELAELAQVRREQQGEDHVAAGPAHEVHGAVVAHEGDDAGHGDERGGAHPVGRGGHAVGDRVHVAAGDVELAGGGGPGPDGDADVEREGEPDEQI